MSIPTVKIHDPNGPNGPNDYVIINERDYDPATMTVWDSAPHSWRVGAILAAVGEVMEAGDESALTTTGMPKVPVLEGILGYNITAEERDVAWIEYTDQ